MQVPTRINRSWDWGIVRPHASDREHVILWHGCTGNDASKIVLGIDPSVGPPDRDFGQGFYTTSIERQARQWAWHRYYSLPPGDRGGGNTPVIIRFRVARAALSELTSLHFVLGDYDNEDFWSLVQHCRQSAPAGAGSPAVIHNHKCNQHVGPSRQGWYDIVSGPVAAFWIQRVAMMGSDQVSFHTTQAADLLNGLIRSGSRQAFRVEPF
jgi:hypothetical protein